MALLDKYNNAHFLARYPLGQIFKDSEGYIGKVLQPPLTLPEELSHDLIVTLRQESMVLKEPGDETIMPSLDMEESSGELLIRFSNPDHPPLSSYLKKNHPVSPKVIIRILDRLSRIFSRLFELGIHRFQLEPDILTWDVKKRKMYYVDTGLANLAKHPDLVQLGYFDGKPQFLPPELLRLGELGAASEVYVFAVFSHYLLSGSLPFENFSPAAAAAFCINEVLPPVNRFEDLREKEVNQLLARGAEKKPEKRISSLEEFLAKLGEIIGTGGS